MVDAGISDPKYVWLLGKRYPVIECYTAPSPHNIRKDSHVTAIEKQINGSDLPASSKSLDANSHDSDEAAFDVSLDEPHTTDEISTQSKADVAVSADHEQSSTQTALSIAVSQTVPDSAKSDDAELLVADIPAEVSDVINLALSIVEAQEMESQEPTAFEYQASSPADTDGKTMPCKKDTDISRFSEERSISQSELSSNAVADGHDSLPETGDVISQVSEGTSALLNESDTSPLQSGDQDAHDLEGDDEVALNPEAQASQDNLHDFPPESFIETFHHGDETVVSISGKIDILDYASSEWKGSTYTAKCLRKGYQMLIKASNCSLMRQVRGDNYCALRATAFQILTQKLHLFQSHSDWEDYLTKIIMKLQKKCDWLSQWTFAERLPSTATDRFEVMSDCIVYFIQQMKLSQAISNDNDRQMHVSALFNSGSNVEIKIFEALKLIMLDTAIRLHEANNHNEEVPVFAWLLFARDTSTNPKNLMLNHLNHAGKSGGLEQVRKVINVLAAIIWWLVVFSNLVQCFLQITYLLYQ